MKVEIREIGPIKKFEFDLSKNLHLIYGKNNVGKSYAVNILYCVIKNLQNSKDDFGWIQDQHLNSKTIVNKLKKNKDKYINIQSELGKVICNVLKEDFLPGLEKSINNTYQEIFNQNKEKYNIKISTKDYSLFLNYRPNNIKIVEFKLNYSIRARFNSNRNTFNIGVSEKYLKLESSKVEQKNWLAERAVDDLTFRIIVKIWNKFYEQISEHINRLVTMLPAHRSGITIALSGMGELIASLALQSGSGDGSGSEKFGLPSISEPASDYYLRLMSTKPNHSSISKGIGEKIEKSILKGKINIDTRNKRIYYYPDNNKLRIPISEAASMVSELASIVLLLKHGILDAKARDRFLLIIEEPEAHLHPEAQTLLMELFVELTKLNIKTIITSHSNYMFNKLSNLILSQKIEPKEVAVYHIKKGKNGSIVKNDMIATEDGMEDHNFVDTAEQLYIERMKIYNKNNQRKDVN